MLVVGFIFVKFKYLQVPKQPTTLTPGSTTAEKIVSDGQFQTNLITLCLDSTFLVKIFDCEVVIIVFKAYVTFWYSLLTILHTHVFNISTLITVYFVLTATKQKKVGVSEWNEMIEITIGVCFCLNNLEFIISHYKYSSFYIFSPIEVCMPENFNLWISNNNYSHKMTIMNNSSTMKPVD